MSFPIPAADALGLSLRPMTDEDLPFLAELYASTRAAEMAMLGWPDDMQRNFLDQQHRAQHHHFRAAYPSGEWLIVQRGGDPVGRLYLDERPDALHVIDISLATDCRGAGLGGALVGDLLRQARSVGKDVTLRVEKQNVGAARLYRRLGFETIEDEGVYALMRWSSANAEEES